MRALEAQHPVHLVAPSGEHDDGDALRDGALTEPAADLEPVHLGQHQVEQYQIRRRGLGLPQRIRPAPGLGDLVTVALQVEDEQVPDIGLVLDDQDPEGCHA